MGATTTDVHSYDSQTRAQIFAHEEKMAEISSRRRGDDSVGNSHDGRMAQIFSGKNCDPVTIDNMVNFCVGSMLGYGGPSSWEDEDD
jgi:hypothetical protein